jgi:hypothetical protein
LTTKTDRDEAETGEQNSDQEGSDDGSSSSIDWESEDNPYKSKFSGEQRRSSRLATELEEASSTGANIDNLSRRFDTLEDMVADISDRGEARASKSDLDFDYDGLDDDSQLNATGKAREKVQESRQATQARERDAQAQKVYDRLQQGWVKGMSPNSPEMTEVTRLYNEALEDPTKAGQLNTALTLFNSYKRSVTSAVAASPPPPTPNGEGDGDKGDEDTDGADNDNEILEDDGTDDKMTARQRNAKKGSGQGQEGSGSAPPRDFSNLSPSQKFKLHEEGKTPATY